MTKKKSTQGGKPAKGAKAAITKIEAALAEEDPADQCWQLWQVLEPLGDSAAACAASALAHTKKGTPVARAVLRAIADPSESEAADQVVRWCAALERGRTVMRGALRRIWRSGTDNAALESTFANFSSVFIDDPELLAMGVEVARRCNATTLADREARLARATRLAPLIAKLRGSSPERVSGEAELATLGAADRAHVYARVLDEPNDYPQAVAVAAVRTLADDPAISDLAIAAAIADMRYHGNEQLVDVWKQRVASDRELMSRLIRLFEYTAQWATDDDELEPFIHALWPASSRPEVFACVERALASSSEVVREAVCEEWLREAEGAKQFDDAQIDRLVRMAIAIAERGNDHDDQRAANRALFYIAHPAARRALIDGLRNIKPDAHDKLRWNLYFGLSHTIDSPDTRSFVIDQLFVERDEYWALLEIFEDHFALDLHRAVLARLVERAGDPDAIHAACAYAALLVAKKPMPRWLVELAHTVAPWQPTAKEDARRLRYIFEHAAMAAIDLPDPEAARVFVARAEALPPSPFADYHVRDREQKTPSPFADKDGKKKLAALASGKLDRQIEAARSTVAAARAAGKPIAVDDDQLAILAGTVVKWRLLDDRDTKVVWFFDDANALHVYDGYAVVPATLAGAGVAGGEIGYSDGVSRLLDNAGAPNPITERLTMLDAKADRAREVILIGDRLLVFDGAGKNMWDKVPVSLVGLAFTTAAAARDAMARFAANPPPTLARADSWYVEGRGAVRREYYVPKPGGLYNDDGSAAASVLGATIQGRFDDSLPKLELTHRDAATATAAYQAWESGLFGAGGRITSIGVDASATRAEDTLLSTYLDDRYRTDGESAAWHLRAITDITEAIDRANLRPLVPELAVDLGPPASEADIAAYQALVPAPLPTSLVDAWRQVGGAGFTIGATTARFLAPAEVVAQRAELRAGLRTWAETRLKKTKAKAVVAAIDHLDVLATVNDEPAFVFDITQLHEDHRCFSGPELGWWESALGWQIATDLTVLLKNELERRIGDLFRLKLGQRASDATERRRLTKGDKIYEAIVDGTHTLTRTITPTSPGKPTVKTHKSASDAKQFFDAAIAAQRKKGWRSPT